MEKEKLFDSIDGIFAYDTGCTDSGIKDEMLRDEVIYYLTKLDDEKFRVLLSEYIREYFVSEKAIQQGYGIDDVVSFIKWLDDYMGIEL